MTKDKDERRNSPDRLNAEELQAAGNEQYGYLDQTRTHARTLAHGDGVSSAMLNPAYYPKNVKPEALHTEAERNGADFPEGPVPDEVEDQSAKGEDFQTSPQSAPVGMYAQLGEAVAKTGAKTEQAAGNTETTSSTTSSSGGSGQG